MQNLYRTLHFLTKEPKITPFSKEEKLQMALMFYTSIKEIFTKEWMDYSEYRITHIVCLDALSLAGSIILVQCTGDTNRQFDYQKIQQLARKFSVINWSTHGLRRLHLVGRRPKKVVTNLRPIDGA